jgi:hypothetical protein
MAVAGRNGGAGSQATQAGVATLRAPDRAPQARLARLVVDPGRALRPDQRLAAALAVAFALARALVMAAVAAVTAVAALGMAMALVLAAATVATAATAIDVLQFIAVQFAHDLLRLGWELGERRGSITRCCAVLAEVAPLPCWARWWRAFRTVAWPSPRFVLPAPAAPKRQAPPSFPWCRFDGLNSLIMDKNPRRRGQGGGSIPREEDAIAAGRRGRDACSKPDAGTPTMDGWGTAVGRRQLRGRGAQAVDRSRALRPWPPGTRAPRTIQHSG